MFSVCEPSCASLWDTRAKQWMVNVVALNEETEGGVFLCSSILHIPLFQHCNSMVAALKIHSICIHSAPDEPLMLRQVATADLLQQLQYIEKRCTN